MNLLDRILQVLDINRAKEITSAPGWRGTGTRMKKSRTPFMGRGHTYHALQMHIEEFKDKGERDARFRELRAAGTKHVSKFSDVRGTKSIWCVVRP